MRTLRLIWIQIYICQPNKGDVFASLVIVTVWTLITTKDLLTLVEKELTIVGDVVRQYLE